MTVDVLSLPSLPSLPSDDQRELPDTAAIYFVLAGDTVLYISPSLHLNQHAERAAISNGEQTTHGVYSD